MSKLYFDKFALIFLAVVSSAHAEVQGRYTDWIKALLASKSYEKLINPSLPDSTEAQPVQITCLESSKERFYVGVAQSMIIKAPLEEVAKVIDDIDQYVDLFPGFAQVKVESRAPERLVTYWEQRIPIFFIPNVKYEMIYFPSRPDDKTRVYRYQLMEKGPLKQSDGFIVFTKLGDQTTRYFELDFFNAEWGILETFAPGRIWKDSVDGLYMSDRATQLKAENPTWTSKQAREAAEKTVEKIEKATGKTPGETCADQKTLQWDKAFPGLPLPDQPAFQPLPTPINDAPRVSH